MARITFDDRPQIGMDIEFPAVVVTNTVAEQMVKDYESSTNQSPGGDCFAVSRGRLETAYQTVNSNSIYDDLPDGMATDHYTSKQAFRNLYACSSGLHIGWQGLPEEHRGKGSAGAMVNAGMGDLKNETEIWNGDLEPGALIQVWLYETGYDEVVEGVDDDGYDGYGHSFIFISYERDENSIITGMNIADQGYQNDDALAQEEWEVWWGVNLTV